MNNLYFNAKYVVGNSFKNLVSYTAIALFLASCGGTESGDSDGGQVGGGDIPIPTFVPTPTPVTDATPTPVVMPTPFVTPSPVVSPSPVVVPTPQVTPTPGITPSPVVVPSPPPPVNPVKTVFYAINVGSNNAVNVSNDLQYSGDMHFQGGNLANTNDTISGSGLQDVYRTERWGEFSYQLPLEAGQYDITLQFAEIYWYNPGERVFSVEVEDIRMVSDLDILSEVGRNAALDRQIDGVFVSDGTLNLSFIASTDAAKLSGIVVRGFSSTTEPTPTPTPVVTPSPVASPTPVATPTPVASPTPVVVPSPTPTPIIIPTPSPIVSPSPVATPPPGLDGAALYQEYGCTACHGNDGQQVSQPIVFDNYSYETFLEKIEDDMPPQNPGACVGECAEAVATYAWSLRPQVSCDSEEVLPRRVRLLTKFEYVNTVNDLFSRSDAESLASGIGADTVVRGFDNNADANRITSAKMDAYWESAGAISTSSNLSSWLNTNGCSQNDIGYCFVEKFGREAFRRELSAEEKSEYHDLFNEGENNEQGAQIVARTMLVSPNFLYRTELGQNGQLTQYEIANLLSYTFWGSMPDDVLFEKASNNELGNIGQLTQEVERMISSGKAQRQFIHFGRQWLEVDSVVGLDRDEQLFPTFNDQVASAMDQEVELFLAEVMLQDGYGVGDIFQSNFVFANSDLADFYGLPSVNGSAMQRVDGNGLRGGILSLGALLARNAKFDDSHPIKRGLLVRRNLLCQEFGTPPPVIGEVEPFDPDKPTRERFAAHTANESCSSCHQYIDEIGFAFENYDAVGNYRTTEGNNLAIDASGSISGLERMTDPDVHGFTNLQDLSAVMATEGLAPASECLVETFQRMMHGVAEPDSCTTDNITSRWAFGSIKELWIEMVASQSFARRQ